MRPRNLLNLLVKNAKRGEIRAEGNTIYLYDVVVGDEWAAEYWGGVSPEGFIRLLSGMTGTVHLHINSPGGDVFAGRAIAQAMRGYDGDIIVHVDGVAASIASVIAVSGTKVIMAPGSMLMIHRAWTIAYGNAQDLTSTADLLSKIDGTIAATYAAKAGEGGSADDFLAQMDAETWFTADEAVAAGLADEAVADGPKPSSNARAQASMWDLSAFAKAPKIEAADPVADPPAEPANPVREPEPDAAKVAAQQEHRRRIAAVALLEPVA